MITVVPLSLMRRIALNTVEREQRRQAERGLVHEQQLRTRHHRAPDREHLLLAAGHRPGHLLRTLREDGEVLVDELLGLLDLLRVLADRPRAELEVLATR